MGQFRFPSRLYPIVDAGRRTVAQVVALAEAILQGGARLVQLRWKQSDTRSFVRCAREIRALCHQYGALLIINDRADVAALVGAGGVHLGQDDVPPQLVRPWLPASMVLGWSTHNEVQARAATELGVLDYIAVGPIFPTTTKENPDPVLGLDGLRRIRRVVDLPIVAIGGITSETAMEVLAAGADSVAMIGAIVHDPDPGAATRRLLEQLDR